MGNFLTLTENIPFLVSLAVMLGLLALELLGALMGLGLSELLNGLMPDAPDLDFDAPAGSETLVFGTFLDWLGIGQVPLLMLLVVFLTAFGLTGLGIQALAASWLNGPLPGWLAGGVALAGSLPLVRSAGRGLQRVLPKDESDAVSRKTFVGRVAVVTVGTARTGEPAEARLRDENGQTHYVMIAPAAQGESFPAGTEVLVVEGGGTVLTGMRCPEELRTDLRL
jgi:hypothetical protein